MYQRVSLYWTLSTMSPVRMVKAGGSPSIGPCPMLRTARTPASTSCVLSISCGRYAESVLNADWLPSAGRSASRSLNSTRLGDLSSTICRSDIWTKVVNATVGCSQAAKVRSTKCDSPGPLVMGR